MVKIFTSSILDNYVNKLKIFSIKYVIVTAITSVLVLFTYLMLGSPMIGVDDANIFFVYAKHLADGHGFIYNIGGERVEGFTSMLWVLVLSSFFLVTNNPEIYILIFNVLVVSAGLTCIVDYIDNTLTPKFENNKNIGLFSYYSLIFLALVYSAPGYVSWVTITLMETGLWSTLLILTSMVLLKFSGSKHLNNNVHISILLSLLIITRPESILWGIVFIILLFIINVARTDIRNSVSSITLPFIAYIITLSGLTLFREIYFSYPLPNTYYAKMSPSIYYNLSEGIKYLYGYLSSNVVIVFSVFTIVFGLSITIFTFVKNIVENKDQTYSDLSISYFTNSSILLVGFSIPVIVGGDHFGSFRFYQPIWPLISLNIVYFLIIIRPLFISNIIKQLSSLQKYILLPAIFVGLVVANQANWFNFKTSSRISQEFRLAEDGRLKGQYMNELFSIVSHHPSVGVLAAGGIKYSYDGDIIDLMGLNNLTMGHSIGDRNGIKNHAAFNKDVFYQLAPDIVRSRVIGDKNNIPGQDNSQSFYYRALKGLFDDSNFKKNYSYATLQMKNSKESNLLVAYFSDRYLRELAEHNTYQVQILHNGAK